MKPVQLPQTDSVRELAEFWDTHDVTDFMADLEEPPEPVFGPRSEREVPVRLNHDELEAAKKLANSKGMEISSLIRQWTIEQLRREDVLS